MSRSRRHISDHEIRGGRRWMLQAGHYDNRTNFHGSRFIHTNIFAGPLHVFGSLDWFKWPEHGGRERSLSVSYTLGLRGWRYRLSWQSDDFLPDRSHALRGQVETAA